MMIDDVMIIIDDVFTTTYTITRYMLLKIIYTNMSPVTAHSPSAAVNLKNRPEYL